ncbi:tRNA(Ile)-lysidine synthase [Methanoregula sp. UBA64]|uniref:tRNA(Ile)-lysidine synthase n=1 Tax=Methanoregula sp. UBA64 TaxID=1915554 RepID=UPI0025D0EE81|nr:tRNA(Ile)-lysidine synthase [Methanoregula sp. UBA64]
MQCAACRREAVVFQPYSGKYLCPVHFTKDFEAKAKRAVRRNRWLLPGDRTAVVLTGDAAEAALLAFLHKLTKDRRDVRLSAIAIDEGTGDTGRTVAEQFGVELFSGSFAERYGTTRDALFRAEGPEAAGRICHVLAGDLAAEIAAARGITRLALATTVDDRALSFFSDLLGGTVEETLFVSETLGTARVPVIRPFADIPTTEVYRYAELCGVSPEGAGACGTDGNSDACAALASYDARHPATKFALANLATTLTGIAGTGRATHDRCPACGSPRKAGRCFACEVRKKYTREPGS